MRVTVRLPDDLGKELKERTENVSAYVTDAVSEKIRREKRRSSREEILDLAGCSPGATHLHEENQQFRRQGERYVEKSGQKSES